jgi:hypothetical protein
LQQDGPRRSGFFYFFLFKKIIRYFNIYHEELEAATMPSGDALLLSGSSGGSRAAESLELSVSAAHAGEACRGSNVTCGGLVEEEDGGVAHEPAGDAEATLLPS